VVVRNVSVLGPDGKPLGTGGGPGSVGFGEGWIDSEATNFAIDISLLGETNFRPYNNCFRTFSKRRRDKTHTLPLYWSQILIFFQEVHSKDLTRILPCVWFRLRREVCYGLSRS